MYAYVQHSYCCYLYNLQRQNNLETECTILKGSIGLNLAIDRYKCKVERIGVV